MANLVGTKIERKEDKRFLTGKGRKPSRKTILKL